jgi:hypothetical protein
MYNTVILPAALYGSENWSLTLGDEHRLKGFENRVLRRIYGPKRDEMKGGWRKLHNEELHNCSLHYVIFCGCLNMKLRKSCFQSQESLISRILN